jgi:hypothetical protein
MIRRIKKHLSPGLVLGLIALVVAVGGTSIAVAQNGTDNTLRTRLGGATTNVVQTVTLLPNAQNNGVSDHLVTCPSNPKLGAGVALGGGVIDPRPPTNTRDLAALAQKTDGPSGKSSWLFQFDNDTAEALSVQLHVQCTFSKLNTKRG